MAEKYGRLALAGHTGGELRAEDRRQLGGSRQRMTADGTLLELAGDARVAVAGASAAIPAGTVPRTWSGGPGTAPCSMDLAAHRYVTFTLAPPDGMLYACTQQDWPGVVAAADAAGLVYHISERHWRRYQSRPAGTASGGLLTVLSGTLVRAISLWHGVPIVAPLTVVSTTAARAISLATAVATTTIVSATTARARSLADGVATTAIVSDTSARARSLEV